MRRNVKKLDAASSIGEMKAWNDVKYGGVSSVIRPLYVTTCDSQAPFPAARSSLHMNLCHSTGDGAFVFFGALSRELA